MPAENDGNGRVTLAVVQSDIRHLADKLEEWRAEDRECRRDHENRLRALEAGARRGLFQDIGAYFVAIGAGIAGWLGGKP